ncbi:protein of unknown function [Paenibacillus alvei]|uniref:Uncharacterized protein n=1 Tax=Paenibacillus alvei TaxID=44250 RepID=A0A383RM38_PAEAL|nr:protein of unknown function [Paenibacillus alvei]
MKELEQAVMAAKRQKESTLIDIKVLPKTMTHGYDAWWNVGVAEVSGKKAIAHAYDERRQFLSQARPYYQSSCVFEGKFDGNNLY